MNTGNLILKQEGNTVTARVIQRDGTESGPVAELGLATVTGVPLDREALGRIVHAHAGSIVGWDALKGNGHYVKPGIAVAQAVAAAITSDAAIQAAHLAHTKRVISNNGDIRDATRDAVLAAVAAGMPGVGTHAAPSVSLPPSAEAPNIELRKALGCGNVESLHEAARRVVRERSALGDQLRSLTRALLPTDDESLLDALTRVMRERDEARASLDAAWEATGVAGQVRGLTSLDDVIRVHEGNRRDAVAKAASWDAATAASGDTDEADARAAALHCSDVDYDRASPSARTQWLTATSYVRARVTARHVAQLAEALGVAVQPWSSLLAHAERYHRVLFRWTEGDATNLSSGERGALLTFVCAMADKLIENQDKGGWQDDDAFDLYRRVIEEATELRGVLVKMATTTGPKLQALRKEAMREAADIANMAMMVADNAQRDTVVLPPQLPEYRAVDVHEPAAPREPRPGEVWAFVPGGQSQRGNDGEYVVSEDRIYDEPDAPFFMDPIGTGERTRLCFGDADGWRFVRAPEAAPPPVDDAPPRVGDVVEHVNLSRGDGVITHIGFQVRWPGEATSGWEPEYMVRVIKRAAPAPAPAASWLARTDNGYTGIGTVADPADAPDRYDVRCMAMAVRKLAKQVAALEADRRAFVVPAECREWLKDTGISFDGGQALDIRNMRDAVVALIRALDGASTVEKR